MPALQILQFRALHPTALADPSTPHGKIWEGIYQRVKQQEGCLKMYWGLHEGVSGDGKGEANMFVEWVSEDAHTAHFHSDVNQRPVTGIRASFMDIADLEGPMMSLFVEWSDQRKLEAIMASDNAEKVVEMLRVYIEPTTPRKEVEDCVAAITDRKVKGIKSSGAGWGFKDTGKEGLQDLDVYVLMVDWAELQDALEFRDAGGWEEVRTTKGVQRIETSLFKLGSGGARWDS